MKKIINNLQNRPEHVKTRLVIVFAILATIAIVILWIFINRLVKVPAGDVIKSESPFKAITQIFSKSVDQVKTDYKTQKDSFSESLISNNEPIDTTPVGNDEVNPATDTIISETVTTP